MARAALILFLLLPMIYHGSSRSIKQNLNLLSDGMNQTTHESEILELTELRTTVTCEPVYSFLPCSSTVWGELFMLVVYELLLYLSQQMIQSGSNLFLQMFGTGIFGASLFNVLGVFPQIILLVMFGVSEDSSNTESMAAVVMAMLAGTAIMQLSVGWGSVVAVGSYDLSDAAASETSTSTSTLASSNSDNKKPFSLTGYGVETDNETRHTSMIMLLSMIPVLVLQLAKVINSSTGTRILILISLIITLICLISYSIYQVFQPWIQNRRLDYLLNKFVKKKILGSFLTRNGQPNLTLIKDIFHKVDQDGDASISNDELRALILGIQIEQVGLDKEDFATKVMEEFDISGDAHINEKEFVNGLTKWLTKANNSNKKQDSHSSQLKSSSNKSQNTIEENKSLLAQKKESKSKTDEKSLWNYIKAAVLVIVGTAITAVIGIPLMLTLQEFSTSANIPSFAVSYVVIPVALGYRQMLLIIKSAGEKTVHAASLTFSEIYGGVFTNNITGLATFLLLVYIRDLSWNVSAEVLVILIICTAMGLLGSFITKIPFWTCIIVYLLYPISLLLLYILTEVLGWA
ncbi:sodium/calcium exchanger NCL2-like isoform X2 [Mangifera indica]|uniref:sodium/calcium exchanger NCL2-like isoform X2 n=1 Tax=Mangifera indica TaxID=29780 RepID=UPI001CFA19BA|nr:sodium/calcium exchanger NCL2-like isoform X2 [Mangifera indica]